MARSDVLKNKRKTHRIVIVSLIFISIYFVDNVLLSTILKIKIFQPGVVLSVEKSIEEHKIGIQVGHWKNDELPDELANLRGRSTGAQEYNITEWEVSQKVAQLLKQELEKKNFKVDLLPATVPIDYKADAFISLHADSNNDSSVSGFKFTSSVWDKSGQADRFGADLEKSYLKNSGLGVATFISSEMEYYYAFNYRRFKHTVDPTTPAVIFELGFLSNQKDRRFLLNHPEKAATGLSKGIEHFFDTE